MCCSELCEVAFCCQQLTFTSVSVYVFIHVCIINICIYRQIIHTHTHKIMNMFQVKHKESVIFILKRDPLHFVSPL